MHRFATAALILAAAVCLALPAAAEAPDHRLPLRAIIPLQDGVVIPDEWAGIWEIDLIARDCETSAVLFQDTLLDTICPGSLVEDPESEYDIVCNGSAEGNTIIYTCEGSGEVLAGCTANYASESTTTLAGDGYESTGTVTITYVGACFSIPSSCTRYEQTARRVAAAPPDCESTPVEADSWGAVKSLYR
jgi:hypothetical protein